MSKSQHVLLAGSDDTPLDREFLPDEFGRWRGSQNNPAYWYGGGFALCGCCGANYAPDVEKFNSTFAGKDMYVWQNQANTYNRGVLVGLNLPVNEINETFGTEVEHIQCGDDTISLRLRREQYYGD